MTNYVHAWVTFCPVPTHSRRIIKHFLRLLPFASDLLCERAIFAFCVQGVRNCPSRSRNTHIWLFITRLMFSTLSITPTDRQRAQHAEKNRFCCWLDPDLHKCHSIFSRTLDSCICRRSRLESKNLARVCALPNSKMHIHHYDICLSSITYVRLSKYSLRTSCKRGRALEILGDNRCESFQFSCTELLKCQISIKTEDFIFDAQCRI